jgi:hypothetical protein
VNLSATTLDRVAGLYVTDPGGSLTVVATRDANLVGAEIKSAGDVAVVAGRDVNLATVTTGRTEDIAGAPTTRARTRPARKPAPPSAAPAT